MTVSAVLGCEWSDGRRLETFWEDSDLSPGGLKDMTAVGRKFSDYMQLLSEADIAVAEKSIQGFIAALESDEVAFCVYAELFMSALYPLDSPYRDSALLKIFCEKVLSSGVDIPPLKEEAGRIYGMSALNNRGSKAQDAEVFVENGGGSMLGEIFRQSPLTLMLVADPSCGSCMDMMMRISKDRKVRKKVRDGQLLLLAVFCGENLHGTVDNPENMWMFASAGYGFASAYDINLSPGYYLIDSNGTVVQGVSGFRRKCRLTGCH